MGADDEVLQEGIVARMSSIPAALYDDDDDGSASAEATAGDTEDSFRGLKVENLYYFTGFRTD